MDAISFVLGVQANIDDALQHFAGFRFVLHHRLAAQCFRRGSSGENVHVTWSTAQRKRTKLWHWTVVVATDFGLAGSEKESVSCSDVLDIRI